MAILTHTITLYALCCNRVFDLHIDEAHINTMNKLAEEHFDGTIDSHATLFYGTCQDCLTQKTSVSHNKLVSLFYQKINLIKILLTMTSNYVILISVTITNIDLEL